MIQVQKRAAADDILKPSQLPFQDKEGQSVRVTMSERCNQESTEAADVD